MRKALVAMCAKRKIKMTKMLLSYFLMSYHAHSKKIAKLARLQALSEKKRVISSRHFSDAQEMVLESTRVKRKQRTLDEMLHRRKEWYGRESVGCGI